MAELNTGDGGGKKGSKKVRSKRYEVISEK